MPVASQEPRTEAADPFGVESLEFLEFATFSAEDARSLQDTFAALGFVLAGHHKSKDVLLLRQGDINLAINRQPSSFAHSYATVHGTSVCAVGFRVSDASALHEAALRRGAQDYSGPVGPGESLVPAVRSVSGSLIYLVDRPAGERSVYSTDFFPAPQPVAASAGLRAVDHVSLTVAPGGTKKWVRFYSKIFGFQVVDHNVVRDPKGRVLSTVIADRRRQIQIIINEPVDHGTDSDRFLQENFGEGVQHIAFATDDIFSFLDDAVKRGLTVLPIPGRYHDDLRREGYASELVEKLRHYQVMIDTEGGGQFLHAYTKSIDGRLFFEVVQRNQHRGFGRHDAAARLAAQQGLADIPENLPAEPVVPDVSEAAVDGSTTLLGIVGDPTAHLRMPEIMGHWLAVNGYNAVWLPFQVRPEELTRFIAGARSLDNLAGFAVAMPHKTAILPLLDEVSERARLAGAVNIVRREADGRLVGDITDGDGFVSGFAGLGGSLDGATILIVGAGSAGRAIGLALAGTGFGRLYVHDLSGERARSLAIDIAKLCPGRQVAAGLPADPKAIDLAVNASPLGMELDDALPFDPTRLRRDAWVADTVMNPEETPLLLAAGRHGCPTYPGRKMLESQVDDYVRFLGWKA